MEKLVFIKGNIAGEIKKREKKRLAQFSFLGEFLTFDGMSNSYRGFLAKSSLSSVGQLDLGRTTELGVLEEVNPHLKEAEDDVLASFISFLRIHAKPNDLIEQERTADGHRVWVTYQDGVVNETLQCAVRDDIGWKRSVIKAPTARTPDGLKDTFVLRREIPGKVSIPKKRPYWVAVFFLAIFFLAISSKALAIMHPDRVPENPFRSLGLRRFF